MRTESLRRVYCDACGEHEEFWLPFEPENIVALLNGRGWKVETYRHTMATPLIIGRVTCPNCAEEA